MVIRKQVLHSYLSNNKQTLLVSFISTFLLGIIAHGYRFANLSLSHDSLNEYYLLGNICYSEGSVLEWKVSLGRFVEPLYQLVFHGTTSSPWLIGLLSLLWLACAVYLTCKLFQLDRPILISLTAGIFTVNISYIATAATYIHDLDANVFAVFLATLACVLWNKGGKTSLGMIPLLIMVMGIYQSMISVAITLIVFKSIMELLKNSNITQVLKKGIQAILLIIVSGIAYFVLVKISCAIVTTSVEQGYNGLTNILSVKSNLLYDVFITYREWFVALLLGPSVSARKYIFILNAIVLLLGTGTVITIFIRNKIKLQNIILTLLLGILMPFAMNIACFLCNGMVHHLMMFSFWLIYFLLLLVLQLLCETCEEEKYKFTSACYYIGIVVICLIMLSNCKTANAAYTKKSLEESTTLSTMTRVLYQLESTTGYEEGVTKVAFIGTPNSDANSMYRNLPSLTGMGMTSSISSVNFYDNYFRYVLDRPINNYSATNLAEYNNIVQEARDNNMPIFPKRGFVRWKEDVLVVRMGE